MAAKARTCSLPKVQEDDSYWETVTGLFPHRMPAARVTQEIPSIRNGVLRVPGKAADGMRLLSIAGEAIPLTPLGEGRWRLPAGQGMGLFILVRNRGSEMVAGLP